ncbi:hypothetical protein [Desulfovibrio sp. IOR2]
MARTRHWVWPSNRSCIFYSSFVKRASL